MAPVVRPAGKERYPYPAYNFIVSINGIETNGEAVSASFTEVSGLQAEITPIDYRDGSDKDTGMRKVRGQRKHPAIVLKRGVSGHVRFWQWINRAIDGDADRQEGYIALLDEDRNEVMRWLFTKAWPTKYTAPTLNAKNNEIAIETLELAVETLVIDV
jgi:phage tail-like protein